MRLKLHDDWLWIVNHAWSRKTIQRMMSGFRPIQYQQWRKHLTLTTLNAVFKLGH
jgi:hypothetical protein